MKQKYYYASTHRFRKGDLVIPRPPRDSIFMTNSPIPHYTLVEQIDMEEWRRRKTWYVDGAGPKRRSVWDNKWCVYEVIPLGKVYHGNVWDEWWSIDAAEVVRCLGNARGILKNAYPHWIEKDGPGDGHNVSYDHTGFSGSAVKVPSPLH